MSMRDRYDDRPRERSREKNRDRDRDRDRRGRDYYDERDRDRDYDRYDRGGDRGGYEKSRGRYDRSRSRSPGDHKDKERERERPRDRVREIRGRDLDSKSPDRGQGYDDKAHRPRHEASRDIGSKPAKEDAKGEVKADDETPVNLSADMTEAEIQMMLSMGIPFSFDTTQGKGVEDPNAKASAIKTSSKRSARQFMNRRGGFNRPLPAERTGQKVIRDYSGRAMPTSTSSSHSFKIRITGGRYLRRNEARTMAPDRVEREHVAPSSSTKLRPKSISPRRSELSTSLAMSTIEDEDHPSRGYKPRPNQLTKMQLWDAMRIEAAGDAMAEPSLASFLHSTILANVNIEKCLSFLLGNKLSNSTVLGAVQIMGLFQEAYYDDPDIIDAAVADILAVKERDPACDKYSQALLYFKGYQAIQSYRVSHWLWCQGRKTLALAIQSRISEVFHVDIHPAAYIGKGVLLDHATGVVIGETAVVGDNVSMLHHVTLGGSGTGRGTIRHPTIGHGVLLGAGVSVLGPVTVGAGSKVGAGSVVVGDIPAHCVAVGVPAKIVKRDLVKEPVKEMDQCSFYQDYMI